MDNKRATDIIGWRREVKRWNDRLVTAMREDLAAFPYAVDTPNARLIAAAPELLEALQQLFEHCTMIHKHWGEGSNARQAKEAQEKALDAIAKATGAGQ